MRGVRISYLIEHPEYIPQLAQWLYRRAVNAVRNHRAQVIEGVVTDFKPMPYTGHAMESFAVNGVRFEYSDFVITAGFNNTSSHGGPIREGLPVKIWYSGGEILRLDIK